MKTAALAILVVIAVAISIVVFGTYGVLAWGFVASKVWLWFAVPFGAPVINVLQAAGLMLLVGIFTHSKNIETAKKYSYKGVEVEQESSTKDAVVTVFTVLVAPWLTLGLAAIIRHYM